MEWEFHTVDAQAVTEQNIFQDLHSIQEEGEHTTDPEWQEVLNKFDMHPTDTSAEGTATPTNKTEESYY